MRRSARGASATLLAAALTAGLAGFSLPRCNGNGEETGVFHGTVEATEVRLAPLIGGRVLELGPREGEAVTAGQLVARLDVTELQLQLEQAQAALRAAEAAERLVHKAVRREDITAAQKALQLSQVQREAAQRDLARVEQLFQRGAVTSKQLDDARSGVEMSVARSDQAQAMLDKLERGARIEEIQAAGAAREQATAAVALLQTRVAHGELRAPSAGRVLYRLAEPGEVVGPGTPLLVLGDLSHPYVDVYVPEREVGAVQLGQAAAVTVDAFADRRFAAKVRHISDQAEFTPKNVQTGDQRARMVFRVRLDVENPGLVLKPGMPAQAALGAAAVVEPGE